MMNFKPYVKAIKNKNEEAFEAVYHETKHAVFAMVLPIVKDRFSAEDVMQITYTKMVENIHSYDMKRSFMTWLLTIAKHTALDMIKSRKDLVMSQQENEDLFISKESSVEKQMLSEFYLSHLNDVERRIVLLKTAGELKHKEIAEIMELPQGTVQYTYKMALQKMQLASKEGQHESKKH